MSKNDNTDSCSPNPISLKENNFMKNHDNFWQSKMSLKIYFCHLCNPPFNFFWEFPLNLVTFRQYNPNFVQFQNWFFTTYVMLPCTTELILFDFFFSQSCSICRDIHIRFLWNQWWRFGSLFDKSCNCNRLQCWIQAILWAILMDRSSSIHPHRWHQISFVYPSL